MLSELADDIILNILWKVEEDPRDWARLSCVSSKLNSLIHAFCWKNKTSLTIPSELLSCSSQEHSLHKLSFCCPGPLHAGILFNNTADFPDEHHHQPTTTTATVPIPTTSSSSRPNEPNECSSIWSLYDDLYHDALYADSEFHQEEPTHEEIRAGVVDVPVESKKRKVTVP
ncbi:hypothetical protein RYX36_020266 [Vicia faba]